ncbi:hypothetical protein HDU76_002635, partial [Blyttiomyces sp. JEL0837]
LTGSIPDVIGALPGLKYLNLGHNKLSGSLPVTIASAPQLTYLNVAYNSLQGDIPNGFFNGTIRYILIDHNCLSSNLPKDKQLSNTFTYDPQYPDCTVAQAYANNATIPAPVGQGTSSSTSSAGFSNAAKLGVGLGVGGVLVVAGLVAFLIFRKKKTPAARASEKA